MKLYQFSGLVNHILLQTVACLHSVTGKKISALGTAEVYCKASPAFWKVDVSSFACSKYMPSWQAGVLIHRRVTLSSWQLNAAADHPWSAPKAGAGNNFNYSETAPEKLPGCWEEKPPACGQQDRVGGVDGLAGVCGCSEGEGSPVLSLVGSGGWGAPLRAEISQPENGGRRW